MDNYTIIESFFDALYHENSKLLNSFLTDDIVFEDPIMGRLEGDEVRYWWQLLCEKVQDFTLEYHKIEVKGDEVYAEWETSYTFYATQRKVRNQLKTQFIIKDGKIESQKDSISYQKWIKQVIGNKASFFIKGTVMQKGIQKQAKALLKAYMRNNKLL